MPGINRANKIAFKKSITESASTFYHKPCIFLSHISIDKQTAIDIGKYITENCDIDIYLDIYDTKLQAAVSDGNHNAITQYIENGLQECSHVVCLVSNSIIRSWWVPYEIGFAKHALKDISTLTLKDVDDLPSYLKICRTVRGTKSLNGLLREINPVFKKSRLLETASESLLPQTLSNHPLDKYLDWRK